MDTALHNALTAWDEANNDSASIETGLDALGRVISAASQSTSPSIFELIRYAGLLVAIYAEHGTDPDGAASQSLYEAAAVLGYDAI